MNAAPGPFRRALVLVCDSLGVGAAPDAAAFGDEASDTLGHVLAAGAHIPHLRALGIGNLPPTFEGARHASPEGAFGKMAEKSAGKDTATGHWELAGLLTDRPFRVYPDGFPPEIVAPFEQRTGRQVLGNRAASGTEILKDLGEEHLRSGRPILYTSADSVFQLAAHEDVIPPGKLYEMCQVGYEIACQGHGVCRVIARPFVGESRDTFKRTERRRDFALPPGGLTLLDHLHEAGWPVYAVGKIEDIFSGRGISEAVHTRSDADGIDRTLEALGRVDRGLIFTNLVDFDMLYGHRNDVTGYARNLEALDTRLPELWGAMRDDDLFVLTADHGCDPSLSWSTDHTREYVPLLMRGARVQRGDLGARESFADLGATLAQNFGVGPLSGGTSLLNRIAV